MIGVQKSNMANQKSAWQEHVERIAEKGVLAKQLYVVLTQPSGSLDAVRDNLSEHLAYQVELERKNIMFAAGPFADDQEQEWQGEGMVIIRAESLEQAHEIAKADPMHQSGARTYRLRPWLLNEGSITIKVTYFNGGREIV